jgi:hypothetical protein
MKTFIRVVELWVPDRTRTRLEFGGCLGSEEYSEFKAVSENALFAYDEGLPGKAWACGHPVILTEFANSYFKRTDEAIEAGLTSGLRRRIPDGRDGAVLRRRRKARRRHRTLAQ